MLSVTSTTVNFRGSVDAVAKIRVKPGPWRWAVIESDLPANLKHIALTVAVRFNSSGEIPDKFRAGLRRIVTDSSRQMNTVSAALDELVSLGWLGVDKGSGTRPSRYWATVPEAALQEAVSLHSDLALQQNPASDTAKRAQRYRSLYRISKSALTQHADDSKECPDCDSNGWRPRVDEDGVERLYRCGHDQVVNP